MAKSKKRFYDGDYSGPLNVARRQEARDYEMISEDHKACANLPQDVKYHAWPKARHYAEYHLDDTIRGIDHQESVDGAKMKAHLQKGKY